MVGGVRARTGTRGEKRPGASPAFVGSGQRARRGGRGRGGVQVDGDECGGVTGSRARRRNGGLGSGRRGGEEARGFSEVVVATGDAVVAATGAIRGRGEAAAAGSSPPRSRSRGEGSERGGGRVGSGEWVRGLGFPGVGIREASWARVELGLSAGGMVLAGWAWGWPNGARSRSSGGAFFSVLFCIFFYLFSFTF